MTFSSPISIFGGAAFAAALLIAPALAAGPSPTDAPRCPQGQVYDTTQQKCVEQSSAAPEVLFEEAVRLTRIYEDHEAALAILWKLDQDDPKVLNYVGFATRKSGDVLRGMMYYYKALEKDPDYVLARSYLGEGYLQMDRADLAEEQLRQIETRCGTSCMEYEALADAIAAHKG